MSQYHQHTDRPNYMQVYSVREEYEDGTVRILQTAVASIALEDLRPNTTVTYQVAAVDQSGREGARSAVLTLRTPLGKDELTIGTLSSDGLVLLTMHLQHM